MKTKIYPEIKIIILFISIFSTTFIKAQVYKQTLVGNTWRLTSLIINDEPFMEVPGTCVYTTEISFSDALYTLNRPCMGITQKTFRIVNNLLILNNSDTLTISRLNLTSFETITNQKAVDDTGKVTTMNITTTYEKK